MKQMIDGGKLKHYQSSCQHRTDQAVGYGDRINLHSVTIIKLLEHGVGLAIRDKLSNQVRRLPDYS